MLMRLLYLFSLSFFITINFRRFSFSDFNPRKSFVGNLHNVPPEHTKQKKKKRKVMSHEDCEASKREKNQQSAEVRDDRG